jgi:hypothetical protein
MKEPKETPAAYKLRLAKLKYEYLTHLRDDQRQFQNVRDYIFEFPERRQWLGADDVPMELNGVRYRKIIADGVLRDLVLRLDASRDELVNYLMDHMGAFWPTLEARIAEVQDRINEIEGVNGWNMEYWDWIQAGGEHQNDDDRSTVVSDVSYVGAGYHLVMSHMRYKPHVTGGSFLQDVVSKATNEITNPDSILRSTYLPAAASVTQYTQAVDPTGLSGAISGWNRVNTVASAVQRGEIDTNTANLTSPLVKETYTPAMQTWLNKHGDTPIETLTVRRAPISKNLDFVFNLITSGQWESAKSKIGYDDMFHLVLIVNNTYIIQKLSVVDFRPVYSSPNSEYMDVPVSTRITIRQLMDNTLNAIGPSRFFRYDAFSNSCQNFVQNILSANNLLTPQLSQFIYQPVDEFLKHLPDWLPTFAKTTTNIGALVGLGHKKHVHRL